jgi:dTMP kinase
MITKVRPDQPGLFVVLEGAEGAGKSTHARWLGERLQAAGIRSRVVREPGGTEAGERVRAVVLDPGLRISPEMELLLILAARAEFVRRVVRPALVAGEVVVADRYELSTYAYQGIARNLGLEVVRNLNAFATGGLKPDAVVLLKVDSEVGLSRKIARPDRLEREDREFHQKVAKAYERLATEEPNVLVVESDATPDEVRARIVRALAGRFPETFGKIEG